MTRHAERRQRSRVRRGCAELAAQGPWLILPEALSQLAGGKLGGAASGLEVRRHVDRGDAAPTGGLAVVTIAGAMAARESDYTAWMGIPTYDRIGQTLAELGARTDVAGIVLDLNSPGGQVAGLPELAAQVRALGRVKPIVAVANPLAASAALWLASAATRFVVSPSGQVGSHGVLMQHTDISGALEKAGVKVTLVASSPKKTEDYPYAPLSEEARTHMQQTVDTLHEEFTAALAEYRGVTRESIRAGWGQGRMVRAADAAQVGMVDAVRTLAQAVAELRMAIGDGRGGSDESGRRGGSVRLQSAVVSGESGPPTGVVQEGDAMFQVSSRTRQILEARGFVSAGASDRDIASQVFSIASARALSRPTTGEQADALVASVFGAATETPPPGAGVLAVAIESVGPPAEGVSAPSPAGAAGVTVAPVVAAVAPGVGASERTGVASGTQAVPAPAIPAVAPASTPAAAPAGFGVSTDDIMAQVRLTGLPPDQQLAVIEQLQAERPANHSVLTARISAALQQYRRPAGALPAAGRVGFGEADADKFRAQAVAHLIARVSTDGLPAEVWDRNSQAMVPFRLERTASNLRSLPRLMEACCLRVGVPAYEAASLQAADYLSLMQGQPSIGITAEQAANVRSMYQSVFLNASDVQARRGYNELAPTFEIWCRRDEPFTDFDPRYSIITGEIPDPKIMAEGQEFEDTITVDGRESWSIDVWGLAFGLTWQMQVGDKLGQFLQIPRKSGQAFRRKMNRLAYARLKQNPTLGNDATALFASRTGRVNTRTGVGAVNDANLEVMDLAFMNMQGLNDEAGSTLGLSAKYLLLPPARYREAWRVTQSPTEIGASQNNASIPNPYKGRYELVVDNELSTTNGGVDTTWYGVADKDQVDGMMYAGLAGAETVRIEQDQFVNSLGMRYRMWTTFGVWPQDFRFAQRMVG